MNEGPEAVVQRCSVKKVFLEISQSSQENPCARASFLIKLQAEACNFITKETLTQVFSREFCKISKNTFFIEHLRTTASAKASHFDRLTGYKKEEHGSPKDR